MSSDEWELLSPRYFSDILVPLFNGGLIAYAVIFVLLFFGTIIMPIIVKLIRKQVTQRYANNSSQVDPNHKKTLLTLTDIPQYLPDDRWSYRLFYYTSLGLGVLYFSFHIAISVWPTTILTTGGKLQLLTADDIEAMIQFLYRWILTGYALVVLSISLGLDFVARWMAVSWPKEKPPDTGPQEPAARSPSTPTPASSTSLPMGQTSLKNVITSIKQSSFLVEIRIEKSNHSLKAGQTSVFVLADLQAGVADLTQRIQTLSKAIMTYIKAHPALYHACRLLCSIPGVGNLTAARLLAEIPDIHGFKNAKQLAAFIGLTPSEYSSGTSVHRRARISKKGNATLRAHLYWPAITAIRKNPVVTRMAHRPGTHCRQRELQEFVN